MNNLTFRRELNKSAEELFPDLLFDFMSDNIQMNIFTGFIRMQCSASIDIKEVVYNGILNESKLKNILKIRVRNALIELQNLVKKDLEKL